MRRVEDRTVVRRQGPKAIKADVACMVEIEDRPTLAAFNSDLLDSRKFKFPLLIDGNDPAT